MCRGSQRDGASQRRGDRYSQAARHCDKSMTAQVLFGGQISG